MLSKKNRLRVGLVALMAKTLENALAHKIEKEFPRIGGPRICKLCADMILEVVNGHIRSRQTVRHGQILWTAVSIDDRPGWSQKIADTDLVRCFWMPAQLRTFSHALMGFILARSDCVRLFGCAIRPMSKVVC